MAKKSNHMAKKSNHMAKKSNHMAKQIAKSVILSTKQPNHMAKQIQSHAEGHPIIHPITWRSQNNLFEAKNGLDAQKTRCAKKLDVIFAQMV